MDGFIGGTGDEKRVREVREDEDRFQEVGVGCGGGDEGRSLKGKR